MILSNIIGSGFIAKSFKKKNNFFKKKKCILYAAGVSNSNNRNSKLFLKDFSRLKKTEKLSKNFKIIYISSCSIIDPARKNSMYLKKKIKNEELIKKKFKNYLIIRLPEIIGKNKNKNTLVNFLYYKILNNKKFDLLKNEKINFIEINDIVNILIELIETKINKRTINIASDKMTNVTKIVKILENVFKKKAISVIKNKKFDNFRIDVKYIKNLKSYKKIKFNERYLINSIIKYKNGNI